MDSFRSALKSKGLKVTPQRLAVHSAMLELGHASADMVCELISEKGEVKVTVSSVYNILTQLSLLGIYSYRLSASNKMFFDVNTYRHIHLYDITTDEYRDIVDDDLMAAVDERLSRRRFKGYKVDRIDIQIVCHPSQKKNVKTN